MAVGARTVQTVIWAADFYGYVRALLSAPAPATSRNSSTAIHDSITNVTGDDPAVTGKLALAHLNEFLDCYTWLEQLEDQAKRKRRLNSAGLYQARDEWR